MQKNEFKTADLLCVSPRIKWLMGCKMILQEHFQRFLNDENLIYPAATFEMFCKIFTSLFDLLLSTAIINTEKPQVW